jgi:hypothetical protein
VLRETHESERHCACVALKRRLMIRLLISQLLCFFSFHRFSVISKDKATYFLAALSIFLPSLLNCFFLWFCVSVFLDM